MQSERMFQIRRLLKPEFVRPIEANLRSAAYASMKMIANANQRQVRTILQNRVATREQTVQSGRTCQVYARTP